MKITPELYLDIVNRVELIEKKMEQTGNVYDKIYKQTGFTNLQSWIKGTEDTQLIKALNEMEEQATRVELKRIADERRMRRDIRIQKERLAA